MEGFVEVEGTKEGVIEGKLDGSFEIEGFIDGTKEGSFEMEGFIEGSVKWKALLKLKAQRKASSKASLTAVLK